MNMRQLVVSDPSQLRQIGQNGPYMVSMEDAQNGGHSQAEAVVNYSKKLQDDLQVLGQKIKYHEDNLKYLKTLKNRLGDSILDMQVSLGKYHTASSSMMENEEPAQLKTEAETVEHILRHEKSAAAILYQLKIQHETQASDIQLTKDVLGVVATLGKVDDDNLSRLLSHYLGLETMLAIVCNTYEGVKALEAYDREGLINKSCGLHAVGASIGRPLDDPFLVICLEHLRPYAGKYIADDPQKRLDLLKPRLPNGETPPGFLGFAVNMIRIDLTTFASSSMKKILEKHDLHKRNIEKLEQPSLDFQNEGMVMQLDEDRNCSKLSTEVVERSHQLRCKRGEELQELSIEELQKLERSLEIELSNVRKIKDEKIMKEINQLKHKGLQLMEENEHLELQVEMSKDHKTTVASDSENIVEDDGEEGQSSKSVTNALNSKDSDHSYTSLKLG